MVQDDKGKPLAGANVILKNTVLGTATDDRGYYIIRKIPVGKPYQLTVMYIGHRMVTRDIQLQEGEEFTADFVMEQTLIDLDEIIVSASFSERKKRAQASPVTVISEDELRRLPVRSVDEIL